MSRWQRFAQSVGILGGVVAVVGFGAVLADAAPVTFQFIGDVTAVSGSLNPPFNSSQTLTGSYTFNSATPDSNPSANIGRYNGTIQALTISVGGYTATLGNSGSNFIEIRNQPSSDRYELRAPLTGSLVSGFSPLRFRIDLVDPTASAFANDHLPTIPPSLSSFSTKVFRIVFEDGDGNARIRGTLTSLTAVPLPTALILFGAGLVALAGLGAGNWRGRRNHTAY